MRRALDFLRSCPALDLHGLPSRCWREVRAATLPKDPSILIAHPGGLTKSLKTNPPKINLQMDLQTELNSHPQPLINIYSYFQAKSVQHIASSAPTLEMISPL